MSKITKNVCFDKDLKQKEDLDFFFISSKDNIVIDYNDTYICFKRPDLIKDVEFTTYYNKEYVILYNFHNLLISQKDYNQLTYRYYSLYKITKTDKKIKSFGFLHDIISYKNTEYFKK